MISEVSYAKMSMKRVKKVDPNPNALFLQWLTEFRDEASIKGNKGLIKIYNMCIENLSKYALFIHICGLHSFQSYFTTRFPLPLENGHQCKIIQGFGKTICQRLDDKLNQHKEEQIRNNLEIPVSPVPPIFPAAKPFRTFSSPPSIKGPTKSHLMVKEKPPKAQREETTAVASVRTEDRLKEESDLEEALRRSLEKIPSKKVNISKRVKSQEEKDFEEALRRSVDESPKHKERSQEEKEVEEALMRSMEEFQKTGKDGNHLKKRKTVNNSKVDRQDESPVSSL